MLVLLKNSYKTAMFAFKCPYTENYISVYLNYKTYYFDYYELMVLLEIFCGGQDNILKKGGCDKIINRLKKARFLKIHEAIVLLDCFLNTEKIQKYILNEIYPKLLKYKKNML
ncbi:unknown protein [Spodoptera frugiperda multiple nucleopolyhedrovirus]|uniref:Sf122 n=1 Tax=Spodoptera frugiperda nuclear polyhedrosis virus TaxID=10455 RepID=A1YJB2_NPVSF|nr:hypothetical protein SFMNPV_gp122 [Spodoptera frugiperda multiple nucleopolyhedrovirus]ABM45832.1 unknown protein [Spodoptera frugiperda multiple nucleopolyhedrovirus]ACA02679.1 unknown [Spodoptera frugiperda multiple nucleopolyhedrovirus]AIW01534.1 hypothetical protein [Spodoptera frugiperda multiple nucleopolyhedrovirus]QED40035.1 hypothetical protein [Spodoptera frugiperda multiple nucleopolyhedrovirus]QED40180.1 hypothetical protein [Spodoptera frugiperda multiple nucleopolyhedrovirus]